MTKRDLTIDEAKGILIFLVVLGHAFQYGFGQDYNVERRYIEDWAFMSIYSFHMPAFMIISGYLFYSSNKKYIFKVMAISKLKSIGVPFFSFSTIIFLIGLFLFDGSLGSTFFEYILQFKSNMWFLSSILINCLIVGCVTRICHNNPIGIAITLFSIFLFFLIVPFSQLTESHKFMFPCFVFGYYLRAFNKKLYIETNYKSLAVITFFFLGCLWLFKGDMLVYITGVCLVKDSGFSGQQLYLDIMRWVIGFYATFWFLSIIKALKVKNVTIQSVLSRWSRISLGIYGFQSIIFYYISQSNLFSGIPFNHISPVITSLIVITICDIILYFAEKNSISKLLFLGGR